MMNLSQIILLLLVGLCVVYATDFDTVKARTTNDLVAGFTTGDVSHSNSYMTSLTASGSWPDVNYACGCSISKSSWPAETHIARLVVMARAWRSPSSTLYHNTALESKLFLAFSYWFTNDFTNEVCTHTGGSGACPCGTPGFWSPNWWWNEIGLPTDMGKACLLISSSTSFATKGLKGCTHVLKRGNFDHGMAGANALWQAQVIILNALINNNATLLNATYIRAQAELYYAPGNLDGIKYDGGFHQHGGLPYAGGYGNAFQETFVDLMLPAVGTAYAVSKPKQDVFSKFMLDGHRWGIIFPKTTADRLSYDFNIVGRELARYPASYSTNALKREKLLNLTVGWTRQAEFQQYMQQMTVSAPPPLGNRLFSSSDLMVHRRPGYTVSLRAYSVRTLNAECVNNEDIFGLHLGDGGTYVYQTTNNYLDTPCAWDWDHVPGTTVDPKAVVLGCANTKNTKATTTFVGGYSDTKHGIFAAEFKGAFTSKLSFHKAWFFFDNEFVVLVSNITTTNASQPVHHTLDSRVRNGASTYLSYGATTASSSTTSGSTYPWWFHHDSIGYVIPANNVASTTAGRKLLTWSMATITSSWSVTATAYPKTPITVPLFTAYLQSKAPPVTADSIGYIVSPNTNQSVFASTRAKQLLSVVRIIQNTASLQAVYQSELRILGLVFWVASTSFSDTALDWNITPNHAAVLQLNFYKNSTTVTFGAADPTQLLTSLSVKVKKIVSCTGCVVSGNYTTIPFTFAAQKNWAVLNVTLSAVPPAARFASPSSSSSSSSNSLSSPAIAGIVIAAVALVAVVALVVILVVVLKRRSEDRNNDRTEMLLAQ